MFHGFYYYWIVFWDPIGWTRLTVTYQSWWARSGWVGSKPLFGWKPSKPSNPVVQPFEPSGQWLIWASWINRKNWKREKSNCFFYPRPRFNDLLSSWLKHWIDKINDDWWDSLVSFPLLHPDLLLCLGSVFGGDQSCAIGWHCGSGNGALSR